MRAIIPIPAFSDNYIWLIRDGRKAVVVDPGEAEPVLATLGELGLDLEAILLTHHHPDHVDGVAALRAARGGEVFAPEPLVARFGGTALRGGELVEFADMDLSLEVLAVPGHTLDHLAFFGAGLLFCGDTLFAAGCGRLFEGTPAQMYASLRALAALPGKTRVCCAHEYTLANLRFARHVEPENETLAAREREALDRSAQGLPTLPSALELEVMSNPFLRCHEPALTAAVSRHRDEALLDPVAVFAALRTWKDGFRA